MSKDRQERALRYGRVEAGRPRTDRPGEHHGEVLPPPNYLTDEQLAAFEGFDPGRLPSGEFTWTSMRGWTALAFQEACQFEGIEVPEAEAVLAEIDLRWPGWPGPYWSEPRRFGPLP